MPEVQWIKIVTEFFDDEKIQLIEAMPDSDMILIIWIKLLTLAGKKNMNGYIFLTENIPYTNEMLSTIFRRPINTIRLALDIFKKFKMINYDDDNILQITNWEKHQNIEGMERIRKLNNKRASSYRKRLMEVGGFNYLEYYQEIFIRDGGKCVYCGSNKNLCIDHLVSLIKKGDNEKDNLVLSCKACNSGKSGKYLEETGYTFINQKTADQYEKVKKRLRITLGITQNHAVEKIRIEKNKNSKKKENISIKESKDSSSKKSKKEGKEPLEFSFEDKCWWGLYDWRLKMYQGAFPMLTTNYLFNDLWKTKFLSDPKKYKKMIKEKYEGKIEKLVWAWLMQAKKFYIRDHPN